MQVGFLKKVKFIKQIKHKSYKYYKESKFIFHKLYCIFLSLKFIITNFKNLINGNVFIVSKLAELGDIIACLAVFDYYSNEIKNKAIFYFNADRINLKLNDNISDINFKQEKVLSYYHWLSLRGMLNCFKKIKLIDLNLNGAWCYRTRKKYLINKLRINEHNYYNYGGLFSSSYNIPYNSILDNRDYSKKILKLEKYEDVLKMDNSKILVIVHANSNDKNRNWTIENWNKILKYFDNEKYCVIEVGFNKTITNNVVQYFPTNDLNKIFNLISKSQLFLGIDSSFAHVAEIFEIPAIIIIGIYNRFSYYIPYSSFYHKNKIKYLVRKNMPTKDIKVEDVQKKLNLVLNEINESEKTNFF